MATQSKSKARTTTKAKRAKPDDEARHAAADRRRGCG